MSKKMLVGLVFSMLSVGVWFSSVRMVNADAVWCACVAGTCCNSGGNRGGSVSGNCSTTAVDYYWECTGPHGTAPCGWKSTTTTEYVDCCDFYDSGVNAGSCPFDNGDGTSSCCAPGGDGGDGGNDGGGNDGGGEEETTTPTTTYTVSGTIYDGSGSLSGGVCTGTGTPIQPGSGSLISSPTWGKAANIAANGTFSMPDVAPGTSVFSLLGMDPAWICSCPGGCSLSNDIQADTTLNFYVTTTQNAWWQTRGGDVGANGGDVISAIPSTCSGACLPYVSLSDALGTANSSGVMWFASGIGNQRYSGYREAAEETDYGAKSTYLTTTRRESYDYFYRLFEMGLTPTEDPHNESNLTKPATAPVNGRAYYYKPDTGTAVIDTAWDLMPGESVVVFVDGNLTINQPIVTDVGEFLAIIVRGNITFSLGNGAPSLATANVQGVFVADGQIVTTTSAQQFVGEGVFVGWGGVDLNRDFGDSTNNANPAEFFSYRPDFVTNAPLRMRRPVIRWEEVAP